MRGREEREERGSEREGRRREAEVEVEKPGPPG